jgi:hypothetical protein
MGISYSEGGASGSYAYLYISMSNPMKVAGYEPPYDIGSFTLEERLKSATVALVPEESLPDWIIYELNHYQKPEIAIDEYHSVRIFKGEWDNRIFYYFYYNYKDSRSFYENGKWTYYFEGDFKMSYLFEQNSNNWVNIYYYGGGVDNYSLHLNTPTFCENLKSSKTDFVTKDSLPEWLVDRINSYYEDTIKKSSNEYKLRIFKGLWENQTIYYVFTNFWDSTLHYEDGREFKLINLFGDSERLSNFDTTSKNWVYIYEYGNGIDKFSEFLN